MKSNEYHYIYKITNHKPTDKRQYYIGVKSSPNPETDNYYSSSEYLIADIEKIGIENFTKEILSFWETRELANLEEIRIHEELDIAINELFYNKAKAKSEKFCTKGYTTVIDTRDNSTKNVMLEDFENNDYYIHNTKGSVQVFDIRDYKMKRVSYDEYTNNKEIYKTGFTDKVFVKDTRNSEQLWVSKEEFKKYDYYVGATKGQMVVLDTRDNTKKNVSIDDYEIFDYYESPHKGKVNVVDLRDNKTKQVSKEDFDKFDYYQSVLVGQVTVFDTRDKIIKNVSRDDYRTYDYYETLMKDKITAIDKRDGSKVSISKHLFDNEDYYISSRSKKINIYDNDGVVIYETWGDFKKVCEKENLPFFALAESYRKGGKSIPLSNSKKAKTRLIGSGFEKHIGWFAKEVKN